MGAIQEDQSHRACTPFAIQEDKTHRACTPEMSLHHSRGPKSHSMHSLRHSRRQNPQSMYFRNVPSPFKRTKVTEHVLPSPFKKTKPTEHVLQKCPFGIQEDKTHRAPEMSLRHSRGQKSQNMYSRDLRLIRKSNHRAYTPESIKEKDSFRPSLKTHFFT